MTENKPALKSKDRMKIAKVIAGKDASTVKPLVEKLKVCVAGMDDLRNRYNIRRKELSDKIAAEKAKTAPKEEIRTPDAEQHAEPVDSAAKSVETENPAANDISVAKDTEDGKVDASAYGNIRVEDFVGSTKRTTAVSSAASAEARKTESKPPIKSDDAKKKFTTFGKKKSFDEGGNKRGLNKKEKIKKGYEHVFTSLEYDDVSGDIMKVRVRKSGSDRDRRKHETIQTQMVIDHAVMTSEQITVKQLSEKIGKTVPEILKKLMLEFSIMKTINDDLDFETAELVSLEFGVKLELKVEQTSEEKLISFHNDETEEDQDPALLKPRPPIVTIMGHVDHGKTSILDYIRKAHVAAGEAGGITQHIGAYTIKVPHEGETRAITFLDTPGHEAFTAMRARGANVTDIVVLVVAADDGIMPQTVEAINHAKAANVPIIVAINKMDKPGANPDKVLQQLADNGLISEDWHGDVPTVKVSAKTGMNINVLLDNILTLAEVSELKANPERTAKGTIIEAKLDKGKGPVATVLVQNGTLHIGDFIVAGTAVGRVRAMFDDKGNEVKSALPSSPVSILGLQDVPNAGDQMMVVTDEKLSREVAEERKTREKIEKLQMKKATLEDVFSRIEEGKLKGLNLIVKADVQGSVEAVKASLLKLSNDEVKVHVVHSGVGAINESDISLATATKAVIIGFNIRPDANAKALAEKDGVDIKLYRIIYDAINDVQLAVKGMLAPTYQETYLGRAEVRQIYRITGVGTIAGCMVKDGKIVKGAKARLIRDSVVVTETSVASLRRIKDDVKEVLAGFDCGIGLEKYGDINEKDIIEVYEMEEIK
jgi:translation initiation factor IF-2